MKILTRTHLWRPVGVAALAVAVLVSGCSGPTSDDSAGAAAPSTDSASPEVDSATVAAPTASVPDPGLHRSSAVLLDPAIPEALMVSPAKSGGECGIELTSTASSGSPLQLSRSRQEHVEGWALYRESSNRPSAVYFKLASDGDASYFAPVHTAERPGLGARLNDATRDDSGFEVTLDLQHVPAGDYVVQIAQRVGDEVLLCATGWDATVSE